MLPHIFEWDLRRLQSREDPKIITYETEWGWKEFSWEFANVPGTLLFIRYVCAFPSLKGCECGWMATTYAALVLSCDTLDNWRELKVQAHRELQCETCVGRAKRARDGTDSPGPALKNVAIVDTPTANTDATVAPFIVVMLSRTGRLFDQEMAMYEKLLNIAKRENATLVFMDDRGRPPIDEIWNGWEYLPYPADYTGVVAAMEMIAKMHGEPMVYFCVHTPNDYQRDGLCKLIQSSRLFRAGRALVATSIVGTVLQIMPIAPKHGA